MKIDLNNHRTNGSRVFSGRDRGYNLRKKLKLDQIDVNTENVTVLIPEDTISLNSSFFLGLFGESVRNLQRSGFEQKYTFQCKDVIRKSIEDGIDRALKMSDPLDL